MLQSETKQNEQGKVFIMQKKSISLSIVFSFFAFLFIAAASTGAQILAEEVRPFDFTDKYYEQNGIFASTLVDRKNGADGQSVFDTANEAHFANVRITATLPGYAEDGNVIFWNYYAGATKESFSGDMSGGEAVSLAYAHPLYVFPSGLVRNTDRQAAIIRLGESYFEKNRIGIAAVFLVEYTDRTATKAGRTTMKELASRNGLSLDGTPIIRTIKELETLSAQGLVSVRQANAERSSFAVAKVMEHPDRGAITPDAFLIYVQDVDGKPLNSEAHFITMFECLRGGGKCF
jgi:hypothetical protein